MERITPYEATLLSYLARHVNLTSDRRKRIMEQLKGDRKVLQVAKALEANKSSDKTPAAQTARALRRWAKVNDTLARTAARKANR
jgi:hypothetical protein